MYTSIGWTEIKWIVSIGAVFALCTSLLGAMFPLPRILYAMSTDGILYKMFKKVHPKTKTPLVATILSGLIAAFMALIFNLHQLIDMMSIGTLLAYTIVAICVLVLRYEDDDKNQVKELDVSLGHTIKQLFNLNFVKHPNELSSRITKVATVAFCVACVILCMLLDYSVNKSPLITILVIATTASLIGLIIVIALQPTSDKKLNFKVPFVPLLPCLSIFINLYLMFQLDINTWIRFIVWIIIGYAIYFTYGIQNSVEGNAAKIESAVSYNSNATKSVDSLQNANLDFIAVSTVALNDKF